MNRLRLLIGSIGLISIAALAAAWVSQHYFEMEPCPWCILQRLMFALTAVLAGIGLCLTRWRWGMVLVAVPGIAAALVGAKSAHWQHFVAAKQSCAFTLADRIVSATQLDTLWPGMFMATASCADAAVDLWGLPYEFWSLGLFMVLVGAWAYLVRWALRSATPGV